MFSVLFVCVCDCKTRKSCEKTIEYIKKICMEIFPTFKIIFSLPSLFTHYSKVFFSTKYFFLFGLDNYHLFYIRMWCLSHFARLPCVCRWIHSSSIQCIENMRVSLTILITLHHWSSDLIGKIYNFTQNREKKAGKIKQ